MPKYVTKTYDQIRRMKVVIDQDKFDATTEADIQRFKKENGETPFNVDRAFVFNGKTGKIRYGPFVGGLP